MNERDKSSIVRVIEPMVRRVRENLSITYGVQPGSRYAYFTGLCDIACAMLEDDIKRYAMYNGIDIRFSTLHGEQRHNPRCASIHWPIQHTWGKVIWNDNILYVDPTSSQFRGIHKDIPEYYISEIPPKWYYDDRENPAFNGSTRKLNKAIRIPLYVSDGNRHRWVKEGIVEFWQYVVWGFFSDRIHSILYK